MGLQTENDSRNLGRAHWMLYHAHACSDRLNMAWMLLNGHGATDPKIYTFLSMNSCTYNFIRVFPMSNTSHLFKNTLQLQLRKSSSPMRN